MAHSLKTLFGSQTRVKLLQIFLLNPDSEYFVRELTRRLDEQINSIRRELLNLKKLGLLKHHTSARKKYFTVDKTFVLYPDLKNIILKMQDNKVDIVKMIASFGTLDLLVLSGHFVNRPQESAVDLLVVGNINRDKLQNYLESNFPQEIKYSLLDRDNFLYRLEYNDKFIFNILTNSENIIAQNKLKKQIAHLRAE